MFLFRMGKRIAPLFLRFRLVSYLLGLAILGVAVLAPYAAWNLPGSDGESESSVISAYDADFELTSAGDLHVTETITVNFPVSRHGIFRFFDRAASGDPHNRAEPHDIGVTMDGDTVPFEVLSQQHGRITNVRIGDPDETVSGQHTYVISYEMDGILIPGAQPDTSEFFWDLIGSGWRQQINKAHLVVHLPEPNVGDVGCAVGVGAASGCTVEGAGTTKLTIDTGRLEPNTPVTVKALLPFAAPPFGDERPWTARWDRVFGAYLWLVIAVALIALGVFIGAALLARKNDESAPGFPLTYAPPAGIGPAQAHYVDHETVNTEQYVATLMYAAERGAITLDRSGDTWTITDKAGARGWDGLDQVTRSVAHLLGGEGSSFVASKKDVAAGQRLKSEISSFEAATKAWGKESGNIVSSKLGWVGGVLVVGAVLLAGANIIWNPFSMTWLSLIPGAFAVGAAPLLAPGSNTFRTQQGRRLWSEVGGFRRVLSTDSSKERFDFSGRQELYTAYVPWAVAFGCADEWAAKYRVEMGSEPPTPSYFGGYYAGMTAGSIANSFANDFNSAVSSAISAYNATQSSSSGGGGFGGGGGGGGGGGSW